MSAPATAIELTTAERDAREAGLRYVSDDGPGIRRLRSRGKFRYVWPDGTPVRDAETRDRIAKLAIPPAYNPSGSVRNLTDTSKRRAATRGDANSIVTTSAGGRRATRRSLPICSNSQPRCRRFATASPRT